MLQGWMVVLTTLLYIGLSVCDCLIWGLSGAKA